MSECTRIEVFDERPVYKYALGVGLILLLISILSGLYIYWDRLDTGSIIQAELLSALSVGLTWGFSSRRFRIKFTLRDGSSLKWQSRSGDYKSKQRAVNKVIEFARLRGLYTIQTDSRQ